MPPRRLFTPAEVPRAPSVRPPPEVDYYDASMESAADQIPVRDPARGKGPEIGEGSGTNGSPFTRRILDEELPRHFRTPQFLDYIGSTDPEDHLGRFENAAMLHQYTDAIKCRVFLTTLVGSALRWFSQLPPSSISSFADFKESFLRHFATSRTYRKTMMDLFATKQRSRESLKEFVHRFNQVAQEVSTATSESRAVKYIHVEEAQSARRKEDPSQQGGSSRNPPAITRSDKRPPPQPLRRPETDPHIAPKSHHRSIHAVTSQPNQATGGCRWLPRFCAYHQSQSHATEECHQYARELRRAAEQRNQGPPAPRRRRSPARQTTREDRPPSARPTRTRDRSPRRSVPPPQQETPRDPQAPRRNNATEDNRSNTPRGSIHMITGGATDGDSHRARKAHSRQLEVYGVGGSRQLEGPIIRFGPQDLEGVEMPHDDALVIRATIANYNIARIFVDTGSSVNIIFKAAFDQMQIDEADLQPMATSLFGFTGNEVQPLGQITLAISLGEEPQRRTRRVPFVIVDAPSAYNVILGRPTLSAFSAVVSTYHQKMKFPVGDQVGEAKGDQLVSRRCYVDMVRTEAKKNRRTQGAEIHAVQEAPTPANFEGKEPLQVCPDRPETVVQVAADLPPELKEELSTCLLRNQDVFAWTPEDITGVSPSVAVHRLNTLPDARPVKQKRRHFGRSKTRLSARRCRNC
ncbi:uncharacterized protein LOC141822780 [Curcuma longa]|uniref:uncharacterized protein LOC141822780 n=1 Tax=Curcuma longa TaxID=136217 RepID=UPI003D9F19B7